VHSNYTFRLDYRYRQPPLHCTNHHRYITYILASHTRCPVPSCPLRLPPISFRFVTLAVISFSFSFFLLLYFFFFFFSSLRFFSHGVFVTIPDIAVPLALPSSPSNNDP